jgi:diacylglycerol O-acyltransferase
MRRAEALVPDQPVSHVDAAWLRMDSRTNPMVIHALLTFAQPVPFAEVERLIRARLLRHERFRQRVVDAGLPLISPHWRTEPVCDLRAHLHHLRLPEPADQAALEQLLSDLASTPLPHDRPLWQAYVIDDVQGGTALFVRLHHAIGDGIALVRILLELCDAPPEPVARVGLGTRRPAPDVLSRSKFAAAQAATLGKLLLIPHDAESIVKSALGGHKRLAWSSAFPLADIKQIALRAGGKVNDVLQSCIAGSLHRYLAARGALPSAAHLRTMVTVFLRDEDHGLGNHFGLVFLDLPVQGDDPRARLAEVKQRMDELKGADDAAVAFAVLDAIGIASPTLEHIALEVFTRKATVLTSNVPGPPAQIQLASRAVTSMLVWAPTSGYLGVSFTLMSYAGEVRLGVLADSACIDDPGALAAAFEAELAALRTQLT